MKVVVAHVHMVAWTKSYEDRMSTQADARVERILTRDRRSVVIDGDTTHVISELRAHLGD